MKDRILNHFSTKVSDYDLVGDRVVMKNDEFHQELIDSIPFATDEAIRILDLGFGTGRGMSLALQRFPNAHVVGIDFSEKMYTRAKENLFEYEGRYKLLTEDFTEADLGSPYDVIISVSAIHNITHIQKEKLFHTIAQSLKPQGAFLNADFIAGETKFLDQQLKNVYRRYVTSKLTEEELEVWRNHIDMEDMPMKLSSQFKFLENCGFKKIDILWNFGNQAIYCAQKSS